MSGISSATALSIAGLGTGLLGSAASAYGKYESGQEQRAAYDYNAAITLQKMQQQMQTSEAEYSQLTGRQASRYAKAGVDIASGSPLLVMAHTAAMGGKEQESEYEAGTEEAALQRYYGQLSAFSGTVGGIDDFLGSASKAIVQYGAMKL